MMANRDMQMHTCVAAFELGTEVHATKQHMLVTACVCVIIYMYVRER